VAVLDGQAALDVDAESGSEERRLDVVHRQRVAGEEDLDVAQLDEPGEIRAGAGVDHGGARDDEDPAGLPADRPHLARDL